MSWLRTVLPFRPQWARFGHMKAESRGLLYLKDGNPTKFLQLLPNAKYGGESIVTLLTGSGSIGAQGARFIRTLFETAKVPVCFERMVVGEGEDRVSSQEFVVSVMRNRTAIHVDIQYDPEEKHKSLLLNNELDLYACVVKMHSIDGYNCRFPDLDITLVTQNNSGDFSKLEYEPVKGVVETLRIIQKSSMRRYLKFVYEYAIKNCRNKITICHKRHELPISDGMFLDLAHEIRCSNDKYRSIEIEEMEVNEIVAQLVLNPSQFDLICSNERYGTAVTSVCSAVCGGASLFSAVEIGDSHAVFKPLQTKLSLTNCRELSPYGIVRACVDLLIHLGNTECAHVMWKELLHTMLVKKIMTKEFGGTDMGEYVICNIVNNLKCKFA